LELFEGLVKEFPKQLPPYDGKLQVLLALGRAEEMARTAGDLVRELPGDAQARLLAAKAFRAIGQSEKSVEQALKAAALAPEDGEVQASVALTEVDQGKFVEAEKRIRSTLASAKNPQPLLVAQGVLELKRAQPAAAERAFSRAVSLDPTDAEAL